MDSQHSCTCYSIWSAHVCPRDCSECALECDHCVNIFTDVTVPHTSDLLLVFVFCVTTSTSFQDVLRKKGNVLFNNTLNTFYLLLHGVGHMVEDHSDNERGNLLLPLHGLLFPISSKGSFICIIPQAGYHIP